MIEIKNVSKTYNGEKKAIKNINFDVNNGEIFAFIGHNGAGKTTMIKSLVGILDFEEGDILINGNSILSAFLSKNVKNVEIADSNVITINTLIPWACMALFALSIAILILIFIAKHNNRYDYLKKHLSCSKKNKKGKNVSLLSPGLICAMLMSFVYMICIEFMTT